MYKNKKWLENEYIVKGLSQSQIAKQFNVKRKTIEYYATKFNLKKFSGGYKYPIDESMIDTTRPEFWYFVGLFLSDGSLKKNVNSAVIRIDDIEPLKEIKKYFKTSTVIGTYQRKGAKTSYELRLSSKKLYKFLEPLSGVDKTFDVKMPKVDNLDNFKMLFRGLIDGDGSVSVKSKSHSVIRFGTASKDMAEGISKELNRFMPEVNQTKHPIHVLKSGKPFYNFTFKDSGVDFLIKIYQDYPKFSIKRKRDLIKNNVNDIVRTYEIINHKNWGIKSPQDNNN